MRRTVLLLPVSISLLLAPFAGPAAAHEGGLEHLDVQGAALAPGGVWGFGMTWHSAHLQAGWLFILNGWITNGTGTVSVELVRPGNPSPVRAWAWDAPGSMYIETTILPETGDYNLTFRNPSSEPVEFEAFFDQSCECLGKLIPVEGGVVIFQADLTVGERMEVTFETGPGLTDLAVDLAVGRDGGDVWPDDFNILRTIRTGSGETSLNHTAEVTARHYMMATAVAGAGMVIPKLTVTPPPEGPFPIGLLLVGSAAVVAAVPWAYLVLRRLRT